MAQHDVLTMISPVSALLMPSLDLLIICLFASSLPASFFFIVRWWLQFAEDENPDRAVAEQERADQEHRDHHGHGHGHGHHHAHA